MKTTAAANYVGTRCFQTFACWIVNNAFAIGPAGWEFERIGAGRYNVYPRQADVPDMHAAIAQASAQIKADGARELPPPDARTFAVNCVPGCFEVWIFNVTAAPIDCDCALIVMVPG